MHRGYFACMSMTGGPVLILLLQMIWFAPSGQASGFKNAPPATMVWAWERAENLNFIDTKKVGVAALVATIKIDSAKRLVCINRRQALNVPPSAYVMPVVRIESRGNLAISDVALIDKIAEILPHFIRANTSSLQIDFDARQTERAWYKKLLSRVRHKLPTEIFLSMTSLASWCLGDNWLNGSNLPVDEVVPMFFEMGADTRPVAAVLERGNPFGHTFQAAGISDREPSINQLLGKSSAGILKPHVRIYMFARTAWTQAKLQKMMEEVSIWK